jgi:hypothetical protein
VSISVATRDAGSASLRRQACLPGGERMLLAGWLELARATLVQRTRFDPLHDQRHESRLRAELPRLAAVARRDGQAAMAIDSANGSLDLELTRDQFAAASIPVLRPLAEALQALAAANDATTVLVPQVLLDVPGIDLALAGAHCAHVLCLDPEVTMSALRALPRDGAIPTGAVPYRTQLPLLGQYTAPDVLTPVRLHDQPVGLMATHVVYAGRAQPLTPAGLVLGRDPGESGLRLPEGVAGLSRRHCTLQREGGRSQIIDHSSYGSWLDGARVRGRALLVAGSTLRLGEPGVELQLIALGN